MKSSVGSPKSRAFVNIRNSVCLGDTLLLNAFCVKYCYSSLS